MNSVETSIFSSKNFPESERIDAFHDSISVVYDTSNPAVSNKEFKGEITSHLLGEILLVETESSEQNFSRSARKIAHDCLDHYMVQTFVYGETQRLDGDSKTSVNNQAVIVYDASEPWEARTKTFSNITLVIPRRVLAGKLENDYGHHGKVIENSDPLGKLLHEYLHVLPKSLQDFGECNPRELVAPSLDLVATVLNQRDRNVKNGGQTEGPQSASFSSRTLLIRRFIDQHIHDSELGVESIQRAFELSRAHLYRLFPSKDGIARYIRERRLDLAYRALQVPGARVGQVAFAHGFRSESTFRRLFKATFGVTASEVIRSDGAHNAHQSEMHSQSTAVWEEWIRKL